MDTVTVEFSEVKSGDPMFTKAAQMIPGELWGPNFKTGADEIFDTADVVFVAHIDDEVIGSICLTRYQGCPYDIGNMEGWVRCWYLKEKYRGRRYGLELLECVINYAKKYPEYYNRYIYAENKGDFLKKVNEAPNLVFVDRERTIRAPDNSKVDIYAISLS